MSITLKENPMANGTRPGGLTALAVLNFVFGGIGLIASAIAFLAIGAVKYAGGELSRELAKEGVKVESQSGGSGATLLYIAVLLTGVGAVLLIASGVGFLKQKRFSGRTLGTVYGLVSLGGTMLGIVTGGFGPGDILFIAYPLLILIMVNTTYKNNLVN
jgi:hypothetical protein